MLAQAILNILEGSSVDDQVMDLLEREMHLLPTEKQVRELKRHQDLQITPDELKALIKSGKYRRHYGLMPGEHFRRKKGKGSFHLRSREDKAYLHWDKWDPRRHPVKHFLEVPALWGPAVAGPAAGAAVGGIIGAIGARRRGLKGRAMAKRTGKWAAVGGLSALAGIVASGSHGVVRRSRRLKALQARDARLKAQ